jgi:hypothetical protein
LRPLPNTCLTTRVSDLSLIDAYTYLQKPTVGIFMKYTLENKALIYINENFWTAELKDLKICRAKNVS